LSLQARLDRIREGFEKEAPAESLKIMHKATADLRASGIMAGVLGEGQRAPDFTLDDSHGNPVSLTQVLPAGPVLLTFFRGDW
jgi:hypothetical protein